MAKELVMSPKDQRNLIENFGVFPKYEIKRRNSEDVESSTLPTNLFLFPTKSPEVSSSAKLKRQSLNPSFSSPNQTPFLKKSTTIQVDISPSNKNETKENLIEEEKKNEADKTKVQKTVDIASIKYIK